jgi:hypothetical protein
MRSAAVAMPAASRRTAWAVRCEELSMSARRVGKPRR